MTRAVQDTNVLASGLLSGSGAPSRVIERWQAGAFELILSTVIVNELERVFRSRYFQTHSTAVERADAIRALESDASMVALAVSISGAAPHPHDDAILATAVSAAADFLVTGDRELRRMGSFRGVRIVTPLEFLELLEAELPREDLPETSSW